MADEIPNLKQNKHIFAAVGAVLGGVAGVAIGGGLITLIGAGIGGLLGYNALKRL